MAVHFRSPQFLDNDRTDPQMNHHLSLLPPPPVPKLSHLSLSLEHSHTHCAAPVASGRVERERRIASSTDLTDAAAGIPRTPPVSPSLSRRSHAAVRAPGPQFRVISAGSRGGFPLRVLKSGGVGSRAGKFRGGGFIGGRRALGCGSCDPAGPGAPAMVW